MHQGSLTLSDFIIRLKLISILELSFIVVNVICNWWRSCHWEMWLSAGFDVGLNGTMAVLVSFCMASSSSYCFGLYSFELLTFIYCVWLSTKKSLSFEPEHQPAWIKIVCPYLPGSEVRGYKITNLSCMNTKAGSHATKYFAALVLNFQLQSF